MSPRGCLDLPMDSSSDETPTAGCDLPGLVDIQFKLLNMAIEIVDLPMKNAGSFHCYVNVY